MEPAHQELLDSYGLSQYIVGALADMRIKQPSRVAEFFCTRVLELVQEAGEKRAKEVSIPKRFTTRMCEWNAPFADHPMGLNSNDVLIVVDVQNDMVPPNAFVEGCGSFGTVGGERVAVECAKLIRAASLQGCTIVATRDFHPANHCSFNTSLPPGPYPPHCLQGTLGSNFALPVHTALTEAIKRSPATVHIAFKGFSEAIDSLGAFPYPLAFAEERLSYAPQFEKANSSPDGITGLCAIEWTGAAAFQCSNQMVDVNAAPDVLAMVDRDKKNLQTILLDRRKRLLICGLALDKAVLDTAIGARLLDDPFERVSIIFDATAAGFIPNVGAFEGGYVTDPKYVADLLLKYNVTLVSQESLLNPAQPV